MSAADDTVTVTIAHGWAVFIDGRHHGGGERVEADQATAEHWIRRGWGRTSAEDSRPRKATSKGQEAR